MTDSNDKNDARSGGERDPEALGTGETSVDEASGDRQELIKAFFRRGAELTEELMEENKRLNYRIVSLEEEAIALRASSSGGSTAAIRELLDRIEELESERSRMRRGYDAVAARSQDFERRHAEIAEENERLANMFVAADQLHSTLDLREVLTIIQEIVLNFIGAREFVVLGVDETTQRLFPLAANHMRVDAVPEMALDEGAIGRSVQTGNVFVSPDIAPDKTTDYGSPRACIPLRLQGKPVGAIIIYRYLVQKKEIGDIDHALFEFLGAHAATAIVGARSVTGADPKPLTRAALTAMLGG